MYRQLFIFLFFFSGIAGLIYETIWSHYLKLFLGHAAYAQTLVLIIYLGGMAAGSWLIGKQVRKRHNLLDKFAFVELLLGVLALIFHPFFTWYQHLSFSTILPALNNTILIFLYKWISASLIILPQSLLLGATFPLMAAGFIRRFPGTSGYSIAVLYFSNTFGAAAGVLLSGFYLVGSVGLPGTIITAGILDIIVGAAILLLDRGNPDRLTVAPLAEKHPRTGTHASIPLKTIRLLLLVSGATATASFMYEIGWIRMLSLVLGSSTHSFELMLSTFILGMAIGSFTIRKHIDRIGNIPRLLVITQVVMGSSALLSVFTYSRMFYFMRFIITALGKNNEGYVLFNIFSDVICMLVMLPSTICAGMIIPLIIRYFYRNHQGESMIGTVYAVNTFGGIIGIIVAVWLLMPFIGVRLLISTGAIIDIGIGLAILRFFPEVSGSRMKRFLPALSAAVIITAVSAGRVDPELFASGVFRDGTMVDDIRIISHKDGRTATVSLYRNCDNLVICTNGKPDAAINVKGGICGDEYTMSLIAVLPLAVKTDISNVAVIGMGSGMTSHFFLYDSSLSSLDIIEIEPAMVEGARKIGDKVANTFRDPRSHIHIEDAKSFFSTRSNKYDVIVSEPSNPWVSGVAGLFSHEFFSHIKDYLNDGGLLVQWFHRYESDMSIIVSIFKALRSSFPNYQLYITGSDLMVIASPDSSADLSLKNDIFSNRTLARPLQQMGFQSLQDLQALYFGSQRTLSPLVDCFDTPANSDYHPFIDLHAVKYRFIDSYVRELDSLASYIIPVIKTVEHDTGTIGVRFRDTLPSISNFKTFYEAKLLHREILSENVINDTFLDEYTSLPMLIDYASYAPHKVTFENHFSSIMDILKKTTPYLSKEEMHSLWKNISDKITGLPLDESEVLWYNYLTSLCNYSRDSLFVYANALLQDEGIIDDDYLNRMLLTSLLCTATTEADSAIAEDAFQRYKLKEAPPLPLRFSYRIFCTQ